MRTNVRPVKINYSWTVNAAHDACLNLGFSPRKTIFFATTET